VAKSSTDALSPTLTEERIEMQEPTRNTFLMEMLLPSVAKFNTDTFDPMFPTLLKLKLDPIIQ
jgi:hypothetical protein